ncbi:MAG: DNA mismatch repair protein MutS [Candidatus Promineifilaceae bacterium]|nr:DNA mismatch repair protein MutS [Candidatus Promineifilaceae bacterium]
MAKRSITPVRQQYLDVKRQYPDAIVFFRLGDFYETFDEDAKIAARELDLTLTGRNVGKNQRVPMAGVPHHAAEGYIAKLIAKGYKVALCEQIGNETVNGLMPRDVTRVFTAGTVVEPTMLDAGQQNYLAAVVLAGERAGLAYADITTGEFATTQVASRRALLEELARLAPKELLQPDGEQELASGDHELPPVSRLPNWRFEEGNARELLRRHFEVSTLASFGCEGKPLAVRAAGAVLAYLQETQKGAVAQIQRLATYQTEGYMALDSATRRNLELTIALDGQSENSLLGVLDQTVTAMGKRMLRERLTRPLVDVGELEARLDQVEAYFAADLQRAEVRVLLGELPDLERLANRTLSGTATPRDLEHIALALRATPELRAAVETLPSLTDSLREVAERLDPCLETASLIERALVEEAPATLNKPGVIKPGFSAELDGVLNSSAHARQWIDELEPTERERTGISSLKVGFNKVFGYYIEVTKANTELVPDDYIRKQTLTNSERYITPELKEYETLVLNAEERIQQIEQRLFAELRQQVGLQASGMLVTARAMAMLDVASALAEVAALNHYARPTLRDDTILRIEAGRHPVVERARQLERFVPNDCHFADDQRLQIITGPNMSGKSTYLRQVALVVLMAQIGSYVPAVQAEIGLVDRIFTRIGAHDELHAGRSTFMVEMVETAEILHHATGKSLLILDEIGRGTSTYDGLSIAWAVVEYLHNHPRLKPRTLFATHYHELTGLAELLPMVANFNVAVAEEGDKVIFLHQIVPGGADRSYGIHVAQLAGLPRDVVNRAREILKELEDHAPTAAVEPSHLQTAQQIALFPEVSPIIEELNQLDVTAMTPLEAINKLYEWKRRYSDES